MGSAGLQGSEGLEECIPLWTLPGVQGQPQNDLTYPLGVRDRAAMFTLGRLGWGWGASNGFPSEYELRDERPSSPRAEGCSGLQLCP